MKRVLIILLLAAPLLADQTVTVIYTDVQANKITAGMGFVNADTCGDLGLAAGCTQGQARTEFCRRQGISGTTCPGSTDIVIYSTIDAFCKREMLKLSDKYDERAAATAQAPAEALVSAPAPQPEPMPVPAPPTAPVGAVVVWYPEAGCPPVASSVALPDAGKAECVVREARLAIVRALLRDHVQPGNASPCWAYIDPYVFANCLDVAARRLPAISYGYSGRWVSGLLYGRPWSGCAAGIGDDPIFVSLAEPWRIWGLHGWEGANEFLWHTFDRADLTDGPLISEAASYATAACGAN